MQKLRQNKGITLIALIITIIVMLILVGVTINVALNGGLIDKTQTATKEMERAQAEELVIASYVFDDIASGRTILSYLDLPATGREIFKNLTANGFKLKDESGNDFATADAFLAANGGAEIITFNLNIQGKHGQYNGNVGKKGLGNTGITIKEPKPQQPQQPEVNEVDTYTFTIGDLAKRGLLALEENRPTLISTKEEFFPETVSEKLKNSEYILDGYDTESVLKIYNITCTDAKYINAFEAGNGELKANSYMFYIYEGTLIFAIANENGNMINANNYEKYTNLSFTISESNEEGSDKPNGEEESDGFYNVAYVSDYGEIALYAKGDGDFWQEKN